MAQLGRCPRLALETLHLLRLGAQPAVQDLQGHDAVQRRVTRLPDGAESPLADALQQLEATQRPTEAGRVGKAGITRTCSTCGG
jgi:hypothetical protein